ncbi:MAG: Ig-like domain-containing protein, partial [Mariprofundaceae bacterium]|nr:Ig-like domain-containing protein [Mariprofundaceae bacterium]
ATSTTVVFEKAVASMNLVTDVTSVSADGASKATLSATVVDAAGLPLANRTVNFTTTSGASLSATSAVTNAVGIASITLTDVTAELANVVASINGFTQTQTITFIPAVNTLTVTVQPAGSAVAADGASVGTIIVTAKDIAGLPIAGQLVTFADSYATSSQLSASSAMTGANGTAQITVSDPVAEQVKITATAGGKTGSGILNFVAPQVSLVASAATPFLADGNNNPVSITVTDQAGVVQANQVFTVSSSSATMIASPISITTNASGVATVQVRDSTAELATLTFTSSVGGAGFGVPIQFVASTANSISLTRSAASAAPDGVASVTITALVRDSYGTAIANAVVDFYTTAGAAILSGSRVFTDGTGHASVSVSNTTPETTTVNARLSLNGGVATSTTVVFEKAVASMNLVTDVTSVSADGASKAT